MKPLIKRIAILGSTGSIGQQTLDIVRANTDKLQVEVLTAQNNADLLIEQALAFEPNAVVIGEGKYAYVKEALQKHDIKVYTGADALCQVVQMETVDMVLAAIVGFAGLRSTIAAIEAGKSIALANKETLVVAGELVTNLAKEKGVNIYPVDSEHSAIFQCLAGEFHNKIEKIYLTASGGPFRGKDSKFLSTVTKADALKHPNWSMGAKITIDSATMMNKGLEIIEAGWLFGLKPEQIDVIIHPQSIIHSLVQFQDGSLKAQMGLPDMKLPIQYALFYPQRVASTFKRFDFAAYPSLTFEKADTATFPSISLAYEAMRKGGNMPCILNAANEIAVSSFLNDEITFAEIPKLVEHCMNKVSYVAKPILQGYIDSDAEARKVAQSLTKKKIHS
ncbi:MAG TPA: 1-deoxy-D-xylulose-5-phosphate reductoisomerase [Bacteroidia bacterium]|nr:1-deoxy-D-xylulose-5-phosphate reductoisomerase [Bacteroidia bacterium]